jgi:hypothetical protein
MNQNRLLRYFELNRILRVCNDLLMMLFSFRIDVWHHRFSYPNDPRRQTKESRGEERIEIDLHIFLMIVLFHRVFDSFVVLHVLVQYLLVIYFEIFDFEVHQQMHVNVNQLLIKLEQYQFQMYVKHFAVH